MQVAQRPPVAPKPRSVVQPLRQPDAPFEQAPHFCPSTAGTLRPTPRLRASNIPPPPESPPPPLPAPRSLSLQRRRDQSCQESSHGKSDARNRVSSHEHHAYSVVDTKAKKNFARQEPVQSTHAVAPSRMEAVGGDSYVAFIPPGTGTMKRRLCRTMSRRTGCSEQQQQQQQQELHQLSQQQLHQYQEPGRSEPERMPRDPRGVTSRPAHSDQYLFNQSCDQVCHEPRLTNCATPQPGINAVVQPNIVPRSNCNRVQKPKPQHAQGINTTQVVMLNSNSPAAEATVNVCAANEPRPRSMSTSTWRRSQLAMQAPPGGSMSVRIRPSPNQPHAGHISGRGAAVRQPPCVEDHVYDDVDAEGRPQGNRTPVIEPDSNTAEHSSPNIYASAHIGDRESEGISPSSSFLEQLVKRNGQGRNSISSVASSLSKDSSGRSTPTSNTQAQFFNAWEAYLKSTNPNGDNNDDGSSSESDTNEEITESSGDEGDQGSGDMTEIGDVENQENAAVGEVESTDDSRKLLRSNAIRRGPRSSGPGELRSILPTDLTPSIPSLLSDDDSKESLSDDVTTTERLCDDCRFWKKMEFRDLDMNAALCSSCQAHRRKRGKAVAELVATEERYGRNLNVVKEVFMLPMKNGLIPTEHCEKIFLNLEELIELNATILSSLKRQVEEITKKADWEDAGHRTTIGKVFQRHLSDMKAFELYCINQVDSTRILNNLSKKSNLLKVFLQVCQNDDDRCANMPLPAFLIAPLQRVTRYPLLLSKILSHTPQRHPDYAALSECLKQLEVLLDKINTATVMPGQTKSTVQSKPSAAKEALALKTLEELMEFAYSQLGWTGDTTRLHYHGPLEVQSQHRSSRKSSSSSSSRRHKTTVVHAFLVCPKEPSAMDDQYSFRLSITKAGATSKPHLVLVGVNKQGVIKCHKEPISLEKCIVAKPSGEVECSGSSFEIVNTSDHVSTLFKAPGPHCRDQWLERLSSVTRSSGLWRQRRRGLANIMIMGT